MVEALAADATLGVAGAAAEAARGMKGPSARNVERLRKKYRKLQAEGGLPEAGEEARLERRARAIRAFYASRKSEINEAKRQLIALETEAESLGIDPRTEDLYALEQRLTQEKESMELFVRGPVDFALNGFLQRGVIEPDEAIAHMATTTKKFLALEKKVEMVRRLRHLRAIADRPA